MVFFAKFDRAADLVSGMAERLDKDTDDPAYAQSFKQMVMACAGCENPEACQKLQAENAKLDAAPDYCRNARIFKD